MVSMLVAFVDVDTGVINNVLRALGMEPVDFISDPAWFRPLYVISDIWKGAGWGSIIYLSALSSISPQLYEAARIDGASRIKQLWYVTLPCLMPTIVFDVDHGLRPHHERRLRKGAPDAEQPEHRRVGGYFHLRL